MAKKDLLKEAKKLGLEVDDSMTVAQIQELIDSASEDTEDTDEEYEEETPKTKKGARYVVAEGAEFRDRNNFDKVYRQGANVSHFDDERLDHLVKTGLVIKK